MLNRISVLYFFLQLHNILLHVYTAICLSIHTLVKIWTAFLFWLLLILYVCVCVCVLFNTKQLFSVLLNIYPEL